MVNTMGLLLIVKNDEVEHSGEILTLRQFADKFGNRIDDYICQAFIAFNSGHRVYVHTVKDPSEVLGAFNESLRSWMRRLEREDVIAVQFPNYDTLREVQSDLLQLCKQVLLTHGGSCVFSVVPVREQRIAQHVCKTDV